MTIRLITLRQFTVFLFMLANFGAVAQNKNIDSLRKIIASSADPKNKVDTYYQLGRLYAASKLDSALLFTEKGLQLAKKISYKEGLAKQYVLQGALSEALGNFETGFLYADSAEKTLKQTKYDYQTSFSNENLRANLYRRKASYGEALEHYLRALSIASKYNNMALIARAHNGVGVLYASINDLKHAEENHLAALNVRLKLNDSMGIVNSYENLGIVNREKKNYTKALTYYFKALQFLSPGDSSSLSFVYNDVGAAYSFRKDFKKAENYLRKSIGIRERIGEKNELAYTYNYLGENFERAGNFPLAEKNIKKALEIATEIKNNKQILEASESLSDFYSRNNQYDSAYAYIKFHNRFKDSIDKIASSELTTQLTTKYETEKKEKALAISTIELQKKRSQLVYSILALIILLLLVAFLIWMFTSKRKKMARQSEYNLQLANVKARNDLQEEKLRISRELHDNIGSQLTFINSSIETLNQGSTDTMVLNETQKATKNAIAELRRTVWLINKQEVDLDEFVIKLRDYVKPYQYGRPETEIIVVYKGNCVLQSLIATNVFRIIQEAINNSLKYAKATVLNISLTYSSYQLNLKITDNGIGFDPLAVEEGYGLKNIQARADALKGRCDIESTPGQGTTVTLQVSI